MPTNFRLGSKRAAIGRRPLISVNRFSHPVLTPTYGLGSYGRTAAAILIGGPRNAIGNQGRIYAFEQRRGRGEAYKQYLLNALGPIPTYKNGWQIIQ